MKVVFRVDASLDTGTGHVMRCLTLAKALRKHAKASVLFICREHEGHMARQIETEGFVLALLSQPNQQNDIENSYSKMLGVSQIEDIEETIKAIEKCFAPVIIDWLIVDHYALDRSWELAIKDHCHQLMVIDDLANRSHFCDLLLDQNYYQDMNSRYLDKVNTGCHCLLGPHYSLLREEFATPTHAQWKTSSPELLLFFGGADQVNATQSAIAAILPIIDSIGRVHVVVGGSNPHAKTIEYLCEQHEKLQYHYAIDYMHNLMQQVQLFVGAVGSTTWERCAIGLPGIVVTVAENQLQLAEDLSRIGSHTYLGIFSNENDFTESYQKEILKILNIHSLWLNMQNVSQQLTDGSGTLEVICMMEQLKSE